MNTCTDCNNLVRHCTCSAFGGHADKSASDSNGLLSSDFSLERLITARKMRTHCKNYTTDDLLNEVVGLYNEYYLPDIEKLKKAAGR